MRLPESVDTPLRTAFCVLVLPPGMILASIFGMVLALLGAPIPVDGLTLDDRASLRDQTHAVVAKLRAVARQRLRDWGHDPGGVD